MPDEPLFAAAAADALRAPAEVRGQAERLLGQARARPQARAFLDQWLGLDDIDDVMKDSRVFPRFGSAVPALLREEAEAFGEQAIFDAGGLRALYAGGHAAMNQTLAGFYGVMGPRGAAFEPVTLDAQQRAGLLTLAGVMALHAGPDQTSPTLRGKFVRERMLCESLPDPPNNVNNTRPAPVATTTARQRVSAHAADPSCAACHRLLDPVGFGLEGFDGAGLYRTSEAGRAIDASGEVADNPIGRFTGAAELGRKLADSPQAARCFAASLVRFAAGRRTLAADATSIDAVARAAGAGGDLRGAWLALVQSDAFLRATGVSP
jgi:hypothetical protein